MLIESLDDLVAREPLEPRESASFREALRQEQRERRRKLAREDPAFERTRASLQAARQRTARAKLGRDDHDLTVLRQKAEAHKSAFRVRGELEALLDAIAHRQSRLRKMAFKIGAKLYAKKPARFRKRFERLRKRAPER